MTVRLDGETLRLEDLEAVAARGESVGIAPSAWERIDASRAVVEDLVARRAVAYGVTTGFGEFANIPISPEKTGELQRNLVMSHAVGVGPPLPEAEARALMVVRANTLAKGYSGVRRELLSCLVGMLNAGVTPVIPEQGSVGASGDLAPLAHMSLPMIGLGEATFKGRTMPGAAAMKGAGVKTVRLTAKEGLALVNGTCQMAGSGGLLLLAAERLLADALVAGAMSLEALEGTDQAFIPEVGRVRPHPGQVRAADVLFALTKGSEILQSHRNCPKVQDAYTIRCMPQVLGAAMDALAYVRRVFEIEVNSATDNPLVFPGRGTVSCGNFHGQPLSIALDLAAIAVSTVANIAERRVDRLVNPHLSGLQAFLIESGGLNSGFMVAQYTAAALVSENKVLSHPASVDSIPTSAGQEDHVSMGPIAAVKLRRVLSNCAKVLAIEYLCAAQGIDLKRPLRSGEGIEAAHRAIRLRVPVLTKDRVLAPDIAAAEGLMLSGAMRGAVASAGIDLTLLAGADAAPRGVDGPRLAAPAPRRRSRSTPGKGAAAGRRNHRGRRPR